MSAMASFEATCIKPGIYYDMPAEMYHAAAGLSNSGIKDLMISPLRFWHRHINPERVEEPPTPEMAFGTALHCAVLEPERFDSCYCRDLHPVDYPDALVTMDDLREWLRNRNLPTTGKLKMDLITRVTEADPNAQIWDVLVDKHSADNAGKAKLSAPDFYRVARATEALRREPQVDQILARGRAEVSIFAEDPDTGVLLKTRIDWVNDSTILDLKTFTQQRGKTIERSIADAIFYEGYYRQAFICTLLDALASGKRDAIASEKKRKPFVLAFVESSEPHEVRLRRLEPSGGYGANVYWERARIEVRRCIHEYARCFRRFGTDPWREFQTIEPLADMDMPQLAY